MQCVVPTKSDFSDHTHKHLVYIGTPYKRKQTELVLFLILIFAGITFKNSWVSPLAVASCTI